MLRIGNGELVQIAAGEVFPLDQTA